MRRIQVGALSVAAIVLLMAPLADAQQFTARFITSAVTWEKFDTVGTSHKLLRGFQSAILDIGQGSFTLHTNMQAATTVADQFEGDSDYRLYSLYGTVRGIANLADVTLGRIPFFHGVGLGTVDGASFTFFTPRKDYKVTVYGGATTPNDYGVHQYGTMKDKFTVGGQFVMSAIPNLRGSLSYVNRRSPVPSYYAVRVDPQTLDPLLALIVPDPEKEQLGGVDASYTFRDLSVYGRYDYDFEWKKTQRAEIVARYTVSPELLVTVDAVRREPRVPIGSFFSQFTLKGVTEVEGGADYFVLPGVRTFVRGAYVAYDGDNSVRYSAGIGRNDIQFVFRGNTGYAGELNSLSLQGAYPLLDNMVVPNAGISYMSYKVDKNAARNNATSAVLGATLRPVQTLSLDLQGQWLNNYIVKSDFRFVGRLHFWLSEHLNLFE